MTAPDGTPRPPPWWDIVFLKLGGLAVLLTGLSPAWIRGDPVEIELVGLGLGSLGGRELLTALLSRSHKGGEHGS